MTTTAKLENGLPDPLIAEITNLKAALARYQTAADTANIHLQRQALDLSTLAAKNNSLRQENSLLQNEIAFLRVNPEPSASSSSASLQISELTLALRRLSDQLNSSEQAFRDQTGQLTRARSACSQANYEAKGAYELVTRAKTREAHALERIRTLEFDLKRKEEERKMADLAVREYADLVRALEGRPSLKSPTTPRSASFAPDRKKYSLPASHGNLNGAGNHPPRPSYDSSSGDPWSHSKETVVSQAADSANGDAFYPVDSASLVKPIDSLQEGRAGLQKLLTEFHEQTEKLEEEISRLHGEREIMEMKLAVCEQVAADEHEELANVQAELANALQADRSAAKMVERYMSFSQQSTNLLQSALQTQKKRHNATVGTLERQISLASAVAEREKGISERLRHTLDEMAIEISRESFGRRRETAMRLVLAERERKIGMMLENWINDMEQKGPSPEGSGNENRLRDVSAAKQILKAICGPPQDTSTTSDSRIQVALSTVQDLSKELESETSRRMLLERENADLRRFQINSEAKVATYESRESKRAANGLDLAAFVETRTASNTLDAPLDMDVSDTPSQSSEMATPAAEVTNTSQSPSKSYLREVENVVDLGSPVNNETNLPVANRQGSNPSFLHSSIDTQEFGHASEQISALRGTSKRYDNLQSAFNDCHDALAGLQASVTECEGGLKGGHLIAAMERLHDYCEDARVELEILVADEARISQGYETLLNISSGGRDSTSSATSNTSIGDDWHLLDQKIEAFVNGTLPSMQKARILFEGKLDNLMHDIAIIKRAMHEEMNPSPGESKDEKASPSALVSYTNGVDFSSQNLEYDKNEVDSNSASNHLTWKTLASSLIPASPLSTARPPSPAPQPAQSFGSLMASGRPRYPSTSSKAAPKPTRGSSDSNPLNRLGLRIAMPRVHTTNGHEPSPSSSNIHSPFPFALRPVEATQSGLDGQPSSAPISRASSGWFSTGGISRARTVSNIHAVGFGIGMAMSPRHASDGAPEGSGVGSETPFLMGRRGSRASRVVGSSGSTTMQDEVE